jgi:hypothetical protein
MVVELWSWFIDMVDGLFKVAFGYWNSKGIVWHIESKEYEPGQKIRMIFSTTQFRWSLFAKYLLNQVLRCLIFFWAFYKY